MDCQTCKFYALANLEHRMGACVLHAGLHPAAARKQPPALVWGCAAACSSYQHPDGLTERTGQMQLPVDAMAEDQAELDKQIEEDCRPLEDLPTPTRKRRK